MMSIKVEALDKDYSPQNFETPERPSIRLTIGKKTYLIQSMEESLVVTTIDRMQIEIDQGNRILIK